MAGRAKENLPGGSLKCHVLYFKIRTVYLDAVTVLQFQNIPIICTNQIWTDNDITRTYNHIL
jgi:hypothetical protein